MERKVLHEPSAKSDFSKPFLFNLTTNKPDKTIDIGKDGLSLSLDAQGRVLQASVYHPEHGIVLAAPFQQFDGSRFYDVSYVRSYRTRMLQWIQQNNAGFGLDFGLGDHHASIKLIETNIALYRFEVFKDVDLSIVAQVGEDGSFVQCIKARNLGTQCILLPYTFRLNTSLNRASYGQLTEGGPLPLPPSLNTVRRSNNTTICVQNPNLGAQLFSALTINGRPLDFQIVKDQESFDAPLNVHVVGKICIPPGETATLCASFKLLSDLEHHEQVFVPAQVGALHTGSDNAKPRWIHDDLLATYVLRRNVEYILANCIIPLSAKSAAVITDHVALPLSWNRDNFWQIRLLLDTTANINSLVRPEFVQYYQKQIRIATRGHLHWLFVEADRPEGFWHRSYLVNGRPKDHAIFQLDQQCYPLLELCEYFDHFPEDVELIKEIVGMAVIQEVLAVLESKKNTLTGLYATEETPGDDAVDDPFHFSSHVLLWRTFSRLRNLFTRLNLSQGTQVPQFDKMAADLKGRTFRFFASVHPWCGRRMFVYLTDGCGKMKFYHDANDIPTLFAREWGFVLTSDEVMIWKNTMDFGLSPANKDGYCSDGVYGGLGSVHSPGTWTLGLYQELAYATSMHNVSAMQAAWTKIGAAMQWDGTFSEAVDPNTAKCTSKAWFSWPGAMIGALLIRMRVNGQEMVLMERSMK